MSRLHEQTLHQRGQTDGKQAQEKMFVLFGEVFVHVVCSFSNYIFAYGHPISPTLVVSNCICVFSLYFLDAILLL